MGKGKYCKCKNTYLVDCKEDENCNTPEYWKQGIGKIYKRKYKIKD